LLGTIAQLAGILSHGCCRPELQRRQSGPFTSPPDHSICPFDSEAGQQRIGVSCKAKSAFTPLDGSMCSQ